MEKILLVIDKHDQSPDARTKAPADTIRALLDAGYQPWYIQVDPSWSHRRKLLHLAGRLLAFALRIPRGAELFVQYPLTNLFWYYLPLLRARRVRITMLVHDLESYRFSGTMDSRETEKFNCAETLILPSPTMEELLRATGLRVEQVRYHYLWPYLLPGDVARVPNDAPPFPLQIIFAGNLDKSAFLSQLGKLQNPYYQIKLYGGGDKSGLLIDDFVSFHGIFSPDQPTITGDWGIIWDGDSLETCSGEVGRYVAINAPHKLSLYLSMGIPVIVWKQAAVAPFVEERGLGIAISNLYELEERLRMMTAEEYQAIKQAVLAVSHEVRTGKLFLSSLQAK